MNTREDTGDKKSETAPAPGKTSSRAGRNLPAAIGVGVAFGAVLTTGLFFPPFLVLLCAISTGLGSWELASALNKKRDYNLPLTLVTVLAPIPTVSAYIWGFTGLGISCIAVALVLACVTLVVPRKRTASRYKVLRGLILILGWVPLTLGISMVYFSTERGWAGILMILLMAVSNDTFGYIAGVIWGKHPIAPTISPKKSWEGFAGSYLGSAVVACIALSILGQKWYWGIPLAAVMVIASTAGDLVESVFKRRIGIKDMSNILPGHGGMMDRLDSVLFAAAVGCLIFTFVLPL